jgi:predicted MFS family arabinose efflux permease
MLVSAVLGIPNGFNNLGLQSALYAAAEPERTGAAAGLFQTFRYIGAVLSTSLIGIVFAGGVSTSGLHEIGIVLAAVGAVALVASLAQPRAGR